MNAYFNNVFAESVLQHNDSSKEKNCLDELPNIYHLAISSISRLVDAFLGITAVSKDSDNESNVSIGIPSAKTPPLSKKKSPGIVQLDKDKSSKCK